MRHGLFELAVEQFTVQLTRPKIECVAGLPEHQHVIAIRIERATEPGNVRPQRARHAVRSIPVPHDLGQPVDRDHRTFRHHQRRQQPLHPLTQLSPTPLAPDPHRTEHRYLHVNP